MVVSGALKFLVPRLLVAAVGVGGVGAGATQRTPSPQPTCVGFNLWAGA